jgi:hypothetical protein
MYLQVPYMRDLGKLGVGSSREVKMRPVTNAHVDYACS